MTTDITELAQSEINDALAQLKQVSEYPATSTQYARVLRKYIASLVEALEKAQGMEAYWKTQCRGITDHCEELQTRIAGLESRTVTVTAAAADVLAERKRQVSVEGWTPSHDDAHKNNEMAFAAACYAFHAAAASWDLEDCGTEYDSHPAPKNWPWEPEWWKPKSARADLVRAGALFLAELERIDRAAGIKVKAK